MVAACFGRPPSSLIEIGGGLLQQAAFISDPCLI